MKQYGDITKLKGYELDPVDLIVGGSPCQDLSVAGKRAGLEGERSGLFMEMIRIIREMRKKTNGIYPRFALWENVPGAFSSNEGADFSAVLGEFARIIEPDAPDVPVPEDGWPKSGILLVSDGSIAWRTHDAQYWGVPQRRRRISLVADFRGESALEILFERKGMSGNTEPSGTQREGSPRTTADSTGETGKSVKILNPDDAQGLQIADSEGCYPTLSGIHESDIARTIDISGGDPTGYQGGVMVLNDQGGSQMNVSEDVTATLRSQTKGHEPLVFDSQVYHGCKEFSDGISQTVNAQYGTGGNNMPLVVSVGNGQLNNISMSEKANALDTMHDQQCVMEFKVFGVYTESQIGSSLKARNDGMSNSDLAVCKNAVRRLTPLECEWLQGFPDNWTNIPGASDSKRYRALGNSIALPFWEHLAHRFAEIGNVKSIGSLFDGIGGFVLVFKRAGAETKWTSEIEPFCEQVVKYHLDNGDL